MKVKVAILVSVLVAGFIIVSNQKSKVNYVDIPCPRCGSCEVLNMGECSDCHDANQFMVNPTKAYCYDCKTTFYVGE